MKSIFLQRTKEMKNKILLFSKYINDVNNVVLKQKYDQVLLIPNQRPPFSMPTKDIVEKAFQRASVLYEQIIASNEVNDYLIVKDEFGIQVSYLESIFNVIDDVMFDSPLIRMINENENTDDYSERLLIPVGKNDQDKTINVKLETKNEKCSLIVAGGTGSGKSEFLHTLIMSSCLKYSPEQLNLYLIDFKDGVEFAPYSDYLQIPHIKLISCRNSVSDALMILEEIESIKTSRNELFKKHNCSNIVQFNKNNPEIAIPRLLIILDEYQVMLNSGNSALSNKCEHALEKLAREIRSAGISLVLSSQTTACGRDVLAQISNRVCFKVKDNSLFTLIDSLKDSDKDLLNSKPVGTAFYSDGEEINLFRAIYTGDTDKKDGTGKDLYANYIKQEFDNPISFLLSNDTRPISFETSSINNVQDEKVDFGVSVFNNAHMFLNFPLESSTFNNPFILGDKSKALEIEMAIVQNLSGKEEQYDINSFAFASLTKIPLEQRFMDLAKWESYSVDELSKKVDEIYDIYQNRLKAKIRGEIHNEQKIVLFINSFDGSVLSAFSSLNGKKTEGFGWEQPASKTLSATLLDLYKNSYRYGIYVIIHFESKEQMLSFFNFNDAHSDFAFYVDQLSAQYYLEKGLSLNGQIEIEDRTSLFVKDGSIYKFRRYTF